MIAISLIDCLLEEQGNLKCRRFAIDSTEAVSRVVFDFNITVCLKKSLTILNQNCYLSQIRQYNFGKFQ